MRNSTKQTVQFKYEDITFFRKNARRQLRCLPQNAPDELIATADGATLKLDNQKNGWRNVCVYHENNGAPKHCPVRTLGRRYLHLRHHGATAKTFLSTFYDEASKRCDITNENITAARKRAAKVLDYPIAKGIPLAGNVGICVCRLHPPNDRHLCLSPTCRLCRADRSATFC